jgi:outer membrane receptor protein involved in Fe transport
MQFKSRLSSLLLLTTAMGVPAAFGQTTAPATGSASAPAAPPEEEAVDISIPGGSNNEIVVVGSRIPNVIRASREVVSVLSQADIARTGEGDIAGALQRVTGLSLVGGRFVYVRGLGERYSLALLNGLPIPSTDPLRRVVPLDLFPTSVIASSIVQKSYSVNFPGEFGGGAINITTRAVPDKPFITVGGSIGANTTTTGQLGYVYDGGSADFTGFDGGSRSIPAGLASALRGNSALVIGPAFSLRQVQDITASLNNRNAVVQANNEIPIDWDINFSAGRAYDVGDNRYGFIVSANWKNNWFTRSGLQQASFGARPPNGSPTGTPVLSPDVDFRYVNTQLRAVVSGLVGIGAEIGDHKIRFTNLYVNDTIKQARVLSGFDNINTPDLLLNRTGTAFFRRQLIDSQVVAEFKFDNLSVDLRGTYANSKRFSPYERLISYAFNTDTIGNVPINDYTNNLNSNGNTSDVSFSRLNENVYGAGGDIGYKFDGLPFPVRLTVGYSYTDNQRTSFRRDFRHRVANGSGLPVAVAQERPDFLLSDFNVYTYGVVLQELSGTAGAAQYDAGLTVHAGYGQIDLEPVDGVQVQAGLRYESGNEFISPTDLFNSGDIFLTPTRIQRGYLLPAGTITWNFAEGMQLRFSGSKTIARPQFRELAPQNFLDTDTDRISFGNQFLVDSQLINLEARYEWYFAKDQRFTISGFYKNINRPIETFLFLSSSDLRTSYANAPSATLYGLEAEAIKYVPLDFINSGEFWDSRRLFLSVNYTFTQSRIKTGAGDTTILPFTGEVRPSTDFYRNGQRLTGQSDHIANVQIGFQDQDGLSEQTLLLNYASDRVSVRGRGVLVPDFVETPGFRLDFVARQALDMFGFAFDLKFEARNLTNTRFQETQRLNGSRVDNNTYNLGRSFQIGISKTF